MPASKPIPPKAGGSLGRPVKRRLKGRQEDKKLTGTIKPYMRPVAKSGRTKSEIMSILGKRTSFIRVLKRLKVEVLLPLIVYQELAMLLATKISNIGIRAHGDSSAVSRFKGAGQASVSRYDLPARITNKDAIVVSSRFLDLCSEDDCGSNK